MGDKLLAAAVVTAAATGRGVAIAALAAAPAESVGKVDGVAYCSAVADGVAAGSVSAPGVVAT